MEVGIKVASIEGEGLRTWATKQQKEVGGTAGKVPQKQGHRKCTRSWTGNKGGVMGVAHVPQYHRPQT